MNTLLIDFSTPDAVTAWRPIDDRVMGGISSSRLRHDVSGHAVFEGEVSRENGGGFASIRAPSMRIDTPDVCALVLEVYGDGKRYKLNLRADERFDGINYQASFQPVAGEWTFIRLEFPDFIPTLRGRKMPDAPRLAPADVRQIGFMIADQQAGPFALAIRAIRTD